MSVKTNSNGACKEPAYIQLATGIRQMIASGQYQPEDKIPSESSISQSYGLSLMTVRQAIGLLVDEGLLRRVHGSGTYVCGPDWTQASFSPQGLLELLNDKEKISIKIIKAGISPAADAIAKSLDLMHGASVVTLVRLVSHSGIPFLLNHAYLKFDPYSPIVESELNVSSLSGLFSGRGNSFIKKAYLNIKPCLPSNEEATRLQIEKTEACFKICYTFYDYKDSPVGSGWFLTPDAFMKLSTKIGVWND